MNAWPEIDFGDLVSDETSGNTKTLQSDYLQAGKYPIVDQGQSLIGGYTNDATRVCKAELPVVIFGDHTKCFKFIDFPFCLGADGTKVLRPKQLVDERYLYHALQRIHIPDAGYSRHFKYLKEGKIPLPTHDEQKRIAAILDQADDLRRQRQRTLDRISRLGQSIFHDMFGDPATNPMGWPIGSIDDLTASTQYGTSSKAGSSGEYAILRMGNISYAGDMDFTDLKFIDFPEKDIEKYTVKLGDILFNRTNSPDLVGKTAVYYGDKQMGFAGYLVRLRLNSEAVPEYVSAYLNSSYGKAVLRGMCKAIIGMANINAKELRGISIPIPPVKLQREFQNRVQEARAIRLAPLAHKQHLEGLIKSLQHRAFRGEL